MKVMCRVNPHKYLTLPPDEKGKRDLVQAGEEFVCTQEEAKQYEKKELVEIISTFPDKDVDVKVEKEEVEEVPEEEKPTKPVIQRRRITKT